MFTITKQLHGTKLTWQSENFSCRFGFVLKWASDRWVGTPNAALCLRKGTQPWEGGEKEGTRRIMWLCHDHIQSTLLISNGRLRLVPHRAGDTWYKLVWSLLIPGATRCFGRMKAVRNPGSGVVTADNRYLQTVKCSEFFSARSPKACSVSWPKCRW